MISFRPNTMIRVQWRKNSYTAGEGAGHEWRDVTFSAGGIMRVWFPCEWVNAFGTDVYTAESLNIRGAATVRMGYVPELFEVLSHERVRIFRNGETDPRRAYATVGQPDNVRMENRMLEFKVQQLEVK